MDSIQMENKFLKIKKFESDKSPPYYYAERLGVDSVAFILHDHNMGYGLIKEFKPPINDFVITAFGGSLDKDKSNEQIVIDEVREEAGYTITNKDITFCGRRFVSTQMNQWCYLFLVEVSGLKPREREPETYWETLAEVVWVSPWKIAESSFSDWKAQAILMAQIGIK